MENEYRDLLGQCISLVKVFTTNRYKERFLPQKKTKPSEKNTSCMMKELLSGIETRISAFSLQPDAETSCPLIKVIKKYNLDAVERTILYYFLGSRFIRFEESSMERVSEFLAGEEPGRQVEMMVTHFHPGSKIMREGIVIKENPPFFHYALGPKIYQQIVKNFLPEPTTSGDNDSVDPNEENEGKRKEEPAIKKAPQPRETYAALNKCVIGQDKTKIALSVAVHRHYHQLLTPNCKISPTNIMMVGPTGVGKTFLVRTLADFLGVPVAFTSANEYSETGYVGRSVGEMVEELKRKSGGSRKKAEQGIIFIDEIDKLAERASYFDHNSNRDVSGRSVQEELLDLLESGGPRNFSYGKHLHHQIEFDTSKILFIAAGAFNGLDKVTLENRREKAEVGFVPTKISVASPKDTNSSIEPAELESYGLIPELLGRFPVICHLAELSAEDLVRIMVEPKDSIVQEYRELFRSFDVEIEFKTEALKEVARIAAERGTGARGLRSVLETTLQPYLFKLADNKDGQTEKCIVINEKSVSCCPEMPDFTEKPAAEIYA